MSDQQNPGTSSNVDEGAFPPPNATDRAGQAPGLSTGSPATGDHDPQLRAALERPRKSAGVSRVTAGLAAAVLLVGGFFGGYAVKGATTDPASGIPAMAGRNGQGGFPGGGSGGAPGQDGQMTFGTITAVDGTTLTITSQSGETVQVDASDATVQVTEDGTVGDLATGDTIVVQGTTGSGGEVTASRISESSGAGPGGGNPDGDGDGDNG